MIVFIAYYMNTGLCRIPCYRGATGCRMMKLDFKKISQKQADLTNFAFDQRGARAPFAPPGYAGDETAAATATTRTLTTLHQF